MPLLKKRSNLAAKIETTVGTAIALGASDGVFNIYEADTQATIPVVDRIGQGGFSRLPAAAGARMGAVKFKTDLIGGASAPAWMSAFLPACGFVVTSLVFSPVSAAPGSGGVKTLSIGHYIDGWFKEVIGAMGNMVLNMKAGEPVFPEFEFKGLWVPPTDVALITPTYVTTKPLRFASSSLTIGGTAVPGVQEMTLDLGNDVQMREDCTTASGYVSAIIVDRKVHGTIKVESRLVASDDRFGSWLAGTEAALTLTLGSTGNALAFAAPKVQFTKIDEGDSNGIAVDVIEFQCNRSASAGDDELTITTS